MNIDITVSACLQLVPVHEKFPVQFLVQLIEDQTSLGSYQSTVCIGITFISNVANRLALGINVIHHMDKVFFIIPVIPVALCHRRVHTVESTLHDIVHILNIDVLLAQRLCLLLGKFTDKLNLCF